MNVCAIGYVKIIGQTLTTRGYNGLPQQLQTSQSTANRLF